ncbi:YSC84-related protein [Rhodovulum sp. DZ06]|uniref:lipid-binding SYLF domain-containing protein n=1 Tax=Rhodovulum sp. DZ06 TaxID=3425126 RepID=UPI003D33D16A
MSSPDVTRRRFLVAAAAVPLGAAALPRAASAATAQEIEADVNRALATLYRTTPGAQELAGRAKGMLIMPKIRKAGLIVGGAYGEGALRVNNATASYWSVAAASLGLQIGAQVTAQALFFMTTAALERFRRSDGWELGAGAEFTVPEDGLGIELNTTVTNRPVIAITFGQDGLMAGASFEGAKYSPIVR